MPLTLGDVVFIRAPLLDDPMQGPDLGAVREDRSWLRRNREHREWGLLEVLDGSKSTALTVPLSDPLHIVRHLAMWDTALVSTPVDTDATLLTTALRHYKKDKFYDSFKINVDLWLADNDTALDDGQQNALGDRSPIGELTEHEVGHPIKNRQISRISFYRGPYDVDFDINKMSEGFIAPPAASRRLAPRSAYVPWRKDDDAYRVARCGHPSDLPFLDWAVLDLAKGPSFAMTLDAPLRVVLDPSRADPRNIPPNQDSYDAELPALARILSDYRYRDLRTTTLYDDVERWLEHRADNLRRAFGLDDEALLQPSEHQHVPSASTQLHQLARDTSRAEFHHWLAKPEQSTAHSAQALRLSASLAGPSGATGLAALYLMMGRFELLVSAAGVMLVAAAVRHACRHLFWTRIAADPPPAPIVIQPDIWLGKPPARLAEAPYVLQQDPRRHFAPPR